MSVDEVNLQAIDVDVILENCPTTIVILNLLVYNSTMQTEYIIIAIIIVCVCFLCVFFPKATVCSVVHENVTIL